MLIARSSANVEDLAGMSGAGLYESICWCSCLTARSSREGCFRRVGIAVHKTSRAEQTNRRLVPQTGYMTSASELHLLLQ